MDFLKKCAEVKNNRNLNSIFTHATSEMFELFEEICKKESNLPSGEDGVIGESVDVILCMFDMIHQTNPDITMDEIEKIMLKKFNKWKEKYGE